MIHEHTLICMNGYQNSTENMENTPKLILTLMVFARILFWEIMLDTYKYGLKWFVKMFCSGVYQKITKGLKFL